MIRHKGFVVAAVFLVALVSGGWFLQRETEPAGSVSRCRNQPPDTSAANTTTAATDPL